MRMSGARRAIRSEAPAAFRSGEQMSHIRRRHLVKAAAEGALGTMLLTASHIAGAQVYPARPVRIIVGFAAGGAPDILARLQGQWLSERLGQPFIVENRPGGGTNLATEAVARAPADGYTLLVASLANAVNATLYEKLNYNFIRDIAPVAGISRDSNVMVVNPSFPTKTVPEFVAYAKANPGKLTYASAGIGSSPHMAGELFKFMAGVDMVHVPYRSSAAALTDLLGGQVQVFFGPMAAVIEYVRGGKLRPMAVTTATRSDALPDIPTVGDFLPGYEASAFYGVGAPRNTPVGIVERLNQEINAGLADPKLKARLVELGSSAFVGSRADFGKLISDETEKWASVVRAANIQPE
jgi:tripartite-type tricarboxylate transporter receptor subunit TctC